MDNIKDIVKPLYTDCFSVTKDGDPTATMEKLLADDFQSIGSVESKGKKELIGQIEFFWKLVPDLKWEIQEMFADDKHVIVRSIASGTPNGDFMGMPTNGTKSFKIMTIDIHTVENKRIKRAHHLEDWATAMRQLKG